MDKTALNPDRRKFLSAAKYAGALGIVALLGKKAAVQTAPAAGPQAPGQPVASHGYHETEHIRKYYRYAGLL